MTPKALVIDDDSMLIDNVTRRLDQVGHTCQGVGTVDHARTSLQPGHDFDYVLLDLELPLDDDSIPDKQNGLNLLGIINRTDPDLPVVVMTAHDHDSSDLSAEVMRHGRAVDYLRKPFPSPPTRHQTLESAVKMAYARRLEQSLQSKTPVKTFQGGELQFFEDRVEILGVTICRDADSGLIRRILDSLAQARSGTTWGRVKGEELAEATFAADSGSIASTISDFRKRVRHQFLEEKNMDCPVEGIITSNRLGYSLAPPIRISNDSPAAQEPTTKKNGPILNDRQRAILGRLQAGEELRNRDLRESFAVSDRTIKRDMNILKRQGLAQFSGYGAAGAWCGASNAAQSNRT